MKLSKKITAKELLGKTSVFVRENVDVGETAKLYAVAGIAKGIETGVSTFGEWVAFVGQFEATIYHSGEIVRAPKAFVPEPLCTMLMGGLEQNDSIEFAFEVGVTRSEDDDDGKVSFEYNVHPLTEVSENTGISHLTKLITLPAPKVEAKAETKAAPKKAK